MIRRRSDRASRGEAGYNMVILVVMVTVMTIAIAAALPLWSNISQRDKEEELIFRGLQYAEAIRCFQRRFQRYPVRLKELIEVKPRCARQLYPDPMTEDGEWGLVYAGGPGTQIRPGQQPNGPQGGNRDQDTGAQNRRGRQDNGLPASRGGERQRGGLGPIAGVYSKSDEEAIKVFMGKTSYDQWAFTSDLVSGIAAVPGQVPIVPSAKTLGRPFPEGVQPQITFQLPNQQQPGQQGRRGQQTGRNGQPQTGADGQPPRGEGRGGFGVPTPQNPQGGNQRPGQPPRDRGRQSPDNQ